MSVEKLKLTVSKQCLKFYMIKLKKASLLVTPLSINLYLVFTSSRTGQNSRTSYKRPFERYRYREKNENYLPYLSGNVSSKNVPTVPNRDPKTTLLVININR